MVTAMRAEPVAVLVVDDDVYILDFISTLLRDAGYRIFTAADATLALRLVEGQKIDIVLSDVKMPGMSGIDLLEKLHANAPDLPVILMTAYADLDLAIDAIKQGAFDFINKPFKAVDLINSLSKAERYVRLVRLERDYKDILEDNVRQRTRELSDRCLELHDLQSGLILAFANAIDAKSRWTNGHSARVSQHATLIAREMGLPAATVEDLRIVGLLHDIGKIGTYDAILDKPGKLTAEEFALVKMHPAKGAEILKPIKQFQHLLPVIRAHHERMDGQGYPDGLKGEAIPLSARIICVADTFDAMTADRPYRSALSQAFAVTELERCCGSQFALEVVKAFIKMLGGSPATSPPG